MTNVTIRPYESSDLEQCRALWSALTEHHRDIYGDPNIGGDAPGLFFDQHLERIGPEHVWVAERNGQVIGLVGLIVEEQEAELEPLVVLPQHRHQGVGQALVAHVIGQTRKLDVRYLNVRPVARNVDAIAFFFRAGFETLGHIELFIDMRSNEGGVWKAGPELFGHDFRH